MVKPPVDPPSHVEATPALPVTVSLYSYTAQTSDGFRMTGSLEAPDGAAVMRVLESMNLLVIDVTAAKPTSTAHAGDEEFLAFHRRLAQVVQAGMPLEKGMRLLAADMRPSRLTRAVALVAGELRNGMPLGQAFEKHRKRFPPLYGRIIDAGIQSENLPGVLLALGRQFDAHQKLRAALWKSLIYPSLTLCGLLIVMAFVGIAVLPRFQSAFDEMRMPISPVFTAVYAMGRVAPYFAAGAVALVLIIVFGRLILKAIGNESAVADRFFLRLPIVGPVLKFDLLARWVGAVGAGMAAGMELPKAIELAGDATASGALCRDGAAWAAALRSAKPSPQRSQLLPASVSIAIDSAADAAQCGDNLRSLAELYQRQANLRLQRIPAILIPLLFLMIAITIGTTVLAVVIPLLRAIQLMSGL